MNINLSNLINLDVESREVLMRFLARTSSSMVDKMPSRNAVKYSTDDILTGLNEIFFFIGCDKYEFELYEDYAKAVTAWLGEQNTHDAEFILNKMNVSGIRVGQLHYVLYNLFDILDENLIEEGVSWSIT